nr:DUF726 domain-containing protein [Arthrobacter jiangjiafuii]
MADLLARTSEDSYILVGHSLGARAMVVTAQTLASKKDGPRVEAMHLLGAAIGGKSDWNSLMAKVDDAVYNYHSVNDSVLKFPYAATQPGECAAGLTGFKAGGGKMQNIDVSVQVKSHFQYHRNVRLLSQPVVRISQGEIAPLGT